ncbi:acyl-CoA dehydrogenase family protein [Streptomyces sp. HNM0574]|uniref:acyl-CoA dehydrogenase family protein n=1 Tax=Streptomyces sp. HNM0574 TaxID=2714954 RepID=UPI00146D3A4A|nr:acyl-CoA dehydrogenase family protein [Streptomyces sp. HNM0574]
MDFTFTEEQQAAAEAARTVLAGTAPDGVPSPQESPGAVDGDFDRGLWRTLADADLLGLLAGPGHGGSGLDPVALCLVLREAGRALARVPLLETSAAAWTLRTYGSEALRAARLPAIARGELPVTVAAHGRTGHEAPQLAVDAARPSREDGDWLLDGVQTAVPWGATAALVLVPARTAAGEDVLALVDPAAEGVTAHGQVSTNGEAYAELELREVRVPDRDVIVADGAVEALRRLLATGTCALALGLGEKVLEMTAEYTGRREQFGHPVATFQAVAVQTADRFIDLRAMAATLWQAAWRLEPRDVAVAKIWAAEGVRRVVQTAQHLHGGFGTDTTYPLHRFHAWAKQLELAHGPAPAHEAELAALLATDEAETAPA